MLRRLPVTTSQGRDQNQAPQRAVTTRTGLLLHKCPTSLTFFSPHPLIMNQACLTQVSAVRRFALAWRLE
jgi:hypothetical protein